ncbi:MAG: hypothetical protein ACRCWJ_05950 [Casimicrobium sp.]
MDAQNDTASGDRKANQPSWEKLPAIQGNLGGCLNCGVRPGLFPMDGIIAVGFGYAALHKNGRPVYMEPNNPHDGEEFMTGLKAEMIAAQDPDNDWQIVLEGPLSGRTYQRHGPVEWVLIEENQGFA